MIPDVKRGSIFAFPTVAIEAVPMWGCRSAHLLFDALQSAYNDHMERAQMRLAPVEPRSWRDIRRAGAHYPRWR